ncbi:MAG: YebC/PmpR family DNA-binding transcriptional regulator [Parcubacteria group bacterium]|nr:YebC/PmpR family DNA-binding transcriptional regulator [Parcubacteria group bacterium]
MSGHSKWNNIKQRKAAQDKKRGASFTKLIRGVEIAAQSGGDPEKNPTLRVAIDSAKKGAVPKDTIDRAIKRGTGEDKDSARMEEALYEGYGPGKVAILVESVTDNKNRAASDIKHAFSKYGGSFGGSGTVKWMFDCRAVMSAPGDASDDLQLALMDAGASEIDDSDGLNIAGPVESFSSLSKVFEENDVKPDMSSIMWVAKDTVELSSDDMGRLQKMLDALDELDDVAEVYTNLS